MRPRTTLAAVIVLLAAAAAFGQDKNAPAAPRVAVWADDFAGDRLDETKWEKFTFEGASGGKIEVGDGEVRIRSAARTRAGIRSKQTFAGERWIVEAEVARVGPGLPESGSGGAPTGYASLTVLFDGSGRNRIEWILTSDGAFEAWAVTDGRGERLDDKKLGTKIKNPVLSIVRRGDEFLFVLNGPGGRPEDAQIGLRATVRNMPKSFHLMLYGYGSSINEWRAARVTVAK